ncbi:uncharacterized protein LOC131674928 [Phymastichus coffea]|uniref:uncharacterized protein LOC131674928 n=1 Tax=Phymastichus coffea TaxID=108790 RepID=UPI00273C911B|nr:uncharacterized protein LOC131674928 [Phymastichus coffea]
MSRPSAKKTNRLENKRLNELNKKASRAQGYKVLEKRSIFSEDDSENERKDELDLEESDGRNYSEPDDNVVMTHEGNENENKKGAERNFTEEDIRKLQMILDLAKAINPEVLKDLDNINKKAGFTKNREVPIVEGSKCKLPEWKLSVYRTSYRKNPKEMVRRLLVDLIGIDMLKKSSAKGGNNREPIPENIFEDVQSFVNLNTKPQFRLTHEQYTAVITSKCATLRNPKGKKGTNICMANGNSSVKSFRRSLSQKTKFHSNQTNSSFKNMTEGDLRTMEEIRNKNTKGKGSNSSKSKNYEEEIVVSSREDNSSDQNTEIADEQQGSSAKEKSEVRKREGDKNKQFNEKSKPGEKRQYKGDQQSLLRNEKANERNESDGNEGKSSEPIFEKQRDGINEVNKERRQNGEKSLEKVEQKSERKESDGTERHEKEQHGKKDTELLVESRRSDGKGLYEEKKIDRKKSEGSDGKIGAKEYRKNQDEIKSKSDDKKIRHEEEQQR